MADYVNQQFECFIPRKDVDVEVNLLILKPVPENVRGVKKIERFSKLSYGAQNTNFKRGHNHGKVKKNLDVMGTIELCLEGKGRFTTEKRPKSFWQKV